MTTEISKWLLPSIFPPFQNSKALWIEAEAETVDLVFNDRMFPGSDTPESWREFTIKFEKVFTVHYLDRFKKSCDDFDLLVGGPVSEGLLSSQTYAVWARTLVNSIFLRCYELERDHVGSIRSTFSRLRTSRQPRRPGIPQFDGHGDYESDNDEPSAGEPDDDEPADQVDTSEPPRTLPTEQPQTTQGRYPLHQIELKGPTLTEAWNSNDDVRAFGLLYPIPSTWTPKYPSGFDVFHGTLSAPQIRRRSVQQRNITPSLQSSGFEAQRKSMCSNTYRLRLYGVLGLSVLPLGSIHQYGRQCAQPSGPRVAAERMDNRWKTLPRSSPLPFH